MHAVDDMAMSPRWRLMLPEAVAEALYGDDSRNGPLSSNVLVSYDGAIKLIDFGIAKAAHRSSMTQAGYVKGKVAYMAPEQIDGAPIDQRTDIFALGIVLYELATMKRAFREATTGATIERLRRASSTSGG
jgi:serine/threonine protein kinase